MSGALQGQVAIVTGGAGGIGAGLCRALSAAGAMVVVTDIDGAGAERVGEELRAAGGLIASAAAALKAHGRRVKFSA